MTNKLTEQQEKRFADEFDWREYQFDGANYVPTSGVKQHLADEIASAKEEVLLGFIKWEFIDDGDTSRTDMLKEAKQYLDLKEKNEQ